MAYENFIPNVWAAGIERQLERKCVFIEDCYRKYEGDIKRMGETVTIKGIGRPTIKTINKGSRSGDIDGPETVATSSIVMPINQIAYYNYEVDDIDRAQAQDGLMEALQEETSEGLANEVDKYIAQLALSEDAKKLAAVIGVTGTASSNQKNVLDILDEMKETLALNDVADGTEIVAEVDPKFMTRVRKEYRAIDTDNSNLMKSGRVFYYNGIKIKVSNNIAKENKTIGGNSKACSMIIMRTKRAIAFVQPLTHTEAYRPEKKFSDAVKGFILYDAKIVRPEEIIVTPVAYL